MASISEGINVCNPAEFVLPFSPIYVEGQLTPEALTRIQETLFKLFPAYVFSEFQALKDRCSVVQYCEELPRLLDSDNKIYFLRENIKEITDREDLLRIMEVARSIFPERAKCAAIEYGAPRFAHMGDYDHALGLALSLENERKIDVLWDVAEEMAKRGDLKQALEIARSFLPEFAEPILTTQAIKRLANMGEYDEALALTDSLNLAIAEGSEEMSWDYDEQCVFQHIALAMAKRGDYDRCLELIDSRLNQDKSQSDLYPCHKYALYDVVCIMVEKGDCDQAIKLVSELVDADRDRALSEIGLAFAERREYEKATEMFLGIKDRWNRSYAVCVMFEIALERGDMDSAEIEHVKHCLNEITSIVTA